MSDVKITAVMMDDSSIDVKKEVDMVFSIANTLRGPYKPDKYKDVIIPMIILRRLECALMQKSAKWDRVAATFEKKKDTPPQVLCRLTGYPFYNTSRYNLKKLLDEAPAIVENFGFYLDSFSTNIQAIFNGLEFKKEIEKLDKNNRLLGVVRKFSELDLDPDTVDSHKMGYMFEEIIRRFSENAQAGDHYTPREVIRMLTSVLLAEGSDDEYNPNRAESAQNKERLGAEFPFTRYFYEYHAPESADAALARFMAYERHINEKLSELTRSGELL